jgi:hypothetical protein
MPSKLPHPPTASSPPPFCMVEFGRELQLGLIFYLFKKNKGKTNHIVEELSRSPNHMCKIGLN